MNQLNPLERTGQIARCRVRCIALVCCLTVMSCSESRPQLPYYVTELEAFAVIEFSELSDEQSTLLQMALDRQFPLETTPELMALLEHADQEWESEDDQDATHTYSFNLPIDKHGVEKLDDILVHVPHLTVELNSDRTKVRVVAITEFRF